MDLMHLGKMTGRVQIKRNGASCSKNTGSKTESVAPATVKTVGSPGRKRLSLKSGNFITSDRITRACSSFRNMFSKKVESTRPVKTNRSNSSKKKMFSDSMTKNSDEDQLLNIRQDRSKKQIGKVTALPHSIDPEHSSDGSSSHIQRFLLDLQNNVQSPAVSFAVPTPIRVREKIRATDAEERASKKRDEPLIKESHREVSAESKQYYQKVFAPEMVNSFDKLLPRFSKRDVVGDLKKKIREAYFANEPERDGYFERKLLEEQLSQSYSTPSEYREYQRPAEPECLDEPLEFSLHFGQEVLDTWHVSEAQKTHMSVMTDDKEVNSFEEDVGGVGESMEYASFVEEDRFVKPWLDGSRRYQQPYQGGSQENKKVERYEKDNATNHQRDDASDGGAFLPFEVRKPEFKYYRRMLY